MNDKSITKYNGLIEASYRLSLNEARIVFYGISLINPINNEFPLEYKIDIKRFAEMFHIESHNVYSMIKDTVMNKFWEREFTFSTEKNKKMRVRWLIGIEYANDDGYLKIFMNPQLQPFLHKLSGNFTRYYIDKIANFKSIYSVRFYEYAIMNLNKLRKSKCQFPLLVEEIKERLEIGEKYKRFSNLKAFVLEPAKKEINKHSDINLTYKVIKLGRSPHKIEFTVTKKSDISKTLRSIKPPSDRLSPAIMEKARKIAHNAGWDIYVIEQEFYAYMRKNGKPDNLEGAFFGFLKKKLSQPN